MELIEQYRLIITKEEQDYSLSITIKLSSYPTEDEIIEEVRKINKRNPELTDAKTKIKIEKHYITTIDFDN